MNSLEIIEYLNKYKPLKPRDFLVHINHSLTVIRLFRNAGFTLKRKTRLNGEKANSFDLFINTRHVGTLYVIVYKFPENEDTPDSIWEVERQDWDIKVNSPITSKDRDYIIDQVSWRMTYGYS